MFLHKIKSGAPHSMWKHQDPLQINYWSTRSKIKITYKLLVDLLSERPWAATISRCRWTNWKVPPLHSQGDYLWAGKIKAIEGQHGSGVGSYFRFLRYELNRAGHPFNRNFLELRLMVRPGTVVNRGSLSELQALEPRFISKLQALNRFNRGSV